MAGIGAERLDRQICHQTAADVILRAAPDIGRPGVVQEGARDHGGKRVAGVHPHAAVGSWRIFGITKAVGPRRVILPWRPREYARQRDADKSHVLARRQAAPAREFRSAERIGHIGAHRQIGEFFDLQQGRRGGEHRRRECRGGNPGELHQCGDVIGRGARNRTVPHLVIDDQQAVRLAAGGAEFLFVNLTEQLALIEFDGPFQIAAEFGPRDVEHLDLGSSGGVEPGGEPGEPAPAPLDAAQPRMMQDRVELLADQRVERGDVAVERGATHRRFD